MARTIQTRRGYCSRCHRSHPNRETCYKGGYLAGGVRKPDRFTRDPALRAYMIYRKPTANENGETDLVLKGKIEVFTQQTVDATIVKFFKDGELYAKQIVEKTKRDA
eukprot:TRINITY_DN4229_c0_g4_i2.p1 TRINITY_DN4229_c0_g4~~TRINITY_DN4229_c0_g4_i2.p1  ORF type:complete len:107 (-),score=5.38 TRINITY_DN4229_c0_g4_i2:149-469(-)